MIKSTCNTLTVSCISKDKLSLLYAYHILILNLSETETYLTQRYLVKTDVRLYVFTQFDVIKCNMHLYISHTKIHYTFTHSHFLCTTTRKPVEKQTCLKVGKISLELDGLCVILVFLL